MNYGPSQESHIVCQIKSKTGIVEKHVKNNQMSKTSQFYSALYSTFKDMLLMSSKEMP